MYSPASIHHLFKEFDTYMHSVHVTQSVQNMYVSYAFQLYDSIDEDLDFDESGYVELVNKFERILEFQCREIVQATDNKVHQINIFVSKRGLTPTDVNRVKDLTIKKNELSGQIIIDTRQYEDL